MTKGAGTAEKWDQCKAWLPDKLGNLFVKYTTSQPVIPLYFKYSNVVIVHNQSRLADLSLGKKCVAEITTLEYTLQYQVWY